MNTTILTGMDQDLFERTESVRTFRGLSIGLALGILCWATLIWFILL